MATFEGATIAPYFPEVIPIMSPISKSDLVKLRKKEADLMRCSKKCHPKPVADLEDDLLKKQRQAQQKGIHTEAPSSF